MFENIYLLSVSCDYIYNIAMFKRQLTINNMETTNKYANAGAIRALIDRIGALRQSIVEANKHMADDIEKKLADIQKALETLQKDTTTIKGEQEKIKADLAEVNTTLDLIYDEVFTPEGVSIIDQIDAKLKELEKKFDDYVTLAKHNEDMAKKADKDHTHTTADIPGLGATLENLTTQMTAVNKTMVSLQEENVLLKNRIKALEDAIAQEVTETDINNSYGQ